MRCGRRNGCVSFAHSGAVVLRCGMMLILCSCLMISSSSVIGYPKGCSKSLNGTQAFQCVAGAMKPDDSCRPSTQNGGPRRSKHIQLNGATCNANRRLQSANNALNIVIGHILPTTGTCVFGKRQTSTSSGTLENRATKIEASLVSGRLPPAEPVGQTSELYSVG